MSKPVLCCDVDSTIYPFNDSVIEAVKEVTGDTVTNGDFNDWHFLAKKYSYETQGEIFKLALDPEKVKHRELYPGCKQVLDILRQMGVELYFLSHNHDPEGMYYAVTEWLAPKFPLASVEILHSDQPKINRLRELAAIGIIDDSPDTLVDAANDSLLAITMRHPWNQEVRNEREDIHSFARWQDLFSGGFLFSEVAARQRARRTV